MSAFLLAETEIQLVRKRNTLFGLSDFSVGEPVVKL